MVSIIPQSPEQAQDMARRLLAATDNPMDVVTDTSGGGTAFVVSDELAQKAGFIGADDALIGDADVEEPPRSGKGSGGDKWRTFLTDAGIDIPDGVTDRDELIAIWDQANSR